MVILEDSLSFLRQEFGNKTETENTFFLAFCDIVNVELETYSVNYL
jgi:hypothetical protein